MQEKKRQDKKQPLPELRTSVTEIMVANGRSFQPFIRTFNYTGENISKAGLGTLLGVFEIDDQSEDSAYIVNFLASVAKKEYWSNPRRGAIESFEAALHKINLALAELVKHGNVSWLGKLHGAIGILEKNNLHFSVTGQAKILLRRNGTLSDISLGLASEESHLHPIKTFIEVSSGRLSATDQALLVSPELLALFSLEELTKQAARMDHEHFTRFLQTALVNELDMAGLMIVDVTEGEAPEASDRKRASVKESLVEARNAFSQSSYAPPQTAETPSVPVTPENVEDKAAESDYVDTKTGHIYVQGDAPQVSEEHPFLEALRLKLQEFPHMIRSVVFSQAKVWRRAKKQTGLLWDAGKEGGEVFGRKLGRALRRYRRKLATRVEKQEEAAPETVVPPVKIPPALVTDIPTPPKPTSEPIAPAVTIAEEVVMIQEQEAATIEQGPELPHLIKEKLSLFYQKKEVSNTGAVPSPLKSTSNATRQAATRILAHLAENITSAAKAGLGYWQRLSLGDRIRTFHTQTIRPSLARGWSRFRSLLQSLFQSLLQSLATKTTKTKTLVFLTIGLIIGGIAFGLFLFLSERNVAETPAGDENQTTFSAPAAPAAQSSGEMTALLTLPGERIVTSVILGDLVYGITPRNIVAIAGGSTFPLPGDERARFATSMDDLRLIFIYTESGKLLAWSPIAKTFVENTLALPEQAAVSGIDTYLTYLYVLDSGTDQIHRFPRAPGGFGTSVSWLKESVAIDDAAHLAVNETLYIALQPSTIKGFFRGRESSTFETGGTLAVTDLYTHPGLANVYALDASHGEILIWNQDGKLVRKLSHEKFAEGTSLSVNEKQGEFFIGTANSLLSYKLK